MYHTCYIRLMEATMKFTPVMFLQMLLHNPVETPKIAEFAFTLTPGEETRVIVAPRISAASKSIINIPLKKRKCFFTSERKLRYYRTYTQRNCVLECEANFTQKNCHCVQYYMPSNFFYEPFLVIGMMINRQTFVHYSIL